jgi:hypothetical protein
LAIEGNVIKSKLWAVISFPILFSLSGCATQAPTRVDDPIYNANIGEFALKVSKMHTDSGNPNLIDRSVKYEESNSWKHWQYNASGNDRFLVRGNYFKNYCAARGGVWTPTEKAKNMVPPSFIGGTCEGNPKFEIRLHFAYIADKLVVGNVFKYYLIDIFELKGLDSNRIESEFKLINVYRNDNFEGLLGTTHRNPELPFEAFVLRDLAAEQRLHKQDQEIYKIEQEQHRAQLAKFEKMRAPGANTAMLCEANIPNNRSKTLDDMFAIEYSPTKGLINKRRVGQEWHSEARIDYRVTLVKSRWDITDDEFVLTESSAAGNFKTVVNRTNGYFVKARLNDGVTVARGSCQG